METRDAETKGSTLMLVFPFLLGAGGLLAYRTVSAAVARSPLAFSAPVLDLGEIGPGGTASGTVWLANPSSAPVRIETVRHSCGCTTSEVARGVPAGGRVPFGVRLVTGRSLGDERQEAHVYAALVTPSRSRFRSSPTWSPVPPAPLPRRGRSRTRTNPYPVPSAERRPRPLRKTHEDSSKSSRPARPC